MNKLATLILFILIVTTSSLSHAAIGDYKVILIHGFQSDQLQTKPSRSQVEVEGADYWKEYWMQYADARIDWPSNERITGKITTDYIWPKLKELSRKEICQPGCILVTHSTGDLIARYLLDNQENWLNHAGLSPLNIVATFDFAGAGGGSELADILVNVTEGGGWMNYAMRFAISLWLGDIPNKANIGVLNDLKVSNARQIAMLPDNRIPRIRFVGNGTDYSKLTELFLPGKDDGIVAAHSSCGASKAGSFKSCSSHLAMNGKIAPQYSGVTSFMPNHYPLIMGNGYSHSDVISSKHKGRLTPSHPPITLVDGHSIKLQSYKENGWLFSKYLYVKDSQQDTMSQIATRL